LKLHPSLATIAWAGMCMCYFFEPGASAH
jgi:hypothetical protein